MRRLHLIILILLTLTACGKKGPVRPLLVPLPNAPGAVELRQSGERFLLAWTIPSSNQDGSPLTDLAAFRIFRMRYLPGEDCPDCRDTSVLWKEVDPAYPGETRRTGDRLFLHDEEVEAGYGYLYRIIPVTARGRTGEIAVVRRPFLPPPQPPQQVAATPHDRFVRLRWEPPAAAPEEIAGYNLYRRTEGEPPPLRPLNDAPLASRSYEDFGLENGRTYLYSVRTVTGKGGELTESAPSEEAAAVPASGS